MAPSSGSGSISTDTVVSEKKGILRSLSFQFKPFYGTSKRNAVYDSTPDENGNIITELGPLKGVQCYGILQKKCKKKNRPTKWVKRFFVLKECFLLYYMPKKRKQFEKTKAIDLRPRGIIPLIGCSIVSGGDIGKKYCLLIAHAQFDSAVIVSANDNKSQEKWLKALREATK
uniref:PH domain-containing protein n=1 Tax=Acrobeloides nanus TaxID=290746 RepID=A0A914CUM3_9BILA